MPLTCTNTVEGMFGVCERGVVGIYQHYDEQHLQRYLDELLGIEDRERARIAA